jgi:signal transduction histidine kinase
MSTENEVSLPAISLILKALKNIHSFQWLIRLSKSRSPWFFLGAVAYSIFTAEVLIMFFFMTIPKLPAIAEAFLDGTLLSFLVAPALYYFLYKPLRIENKERELIEQELRRSAKQLQLQAEQLQEYSQALELKVAERTQELSSKNSQLQGLLEKLHRTQVQMVQTEKMSCLGQLVAGVAHEINNPVNFIHGNVTYVDTYAQDLLRVVQAYQTHYPNPPETLQTTLDDVELGFLREDLGKLLQSIKVGTARIRQIVLSLRNFSRLDESEFKAVDLHEGIDSTLLILQHRLKPKPESPGIEVIKEYSQLPMVECYPGQLNQVFINLLTNAIDVLEESAQQQRKDGQSVQPSRIWISTQVKAENRVQITITDNGSGMSETVRSHIFDPFFTTKPIGKGTGLGLSVSYQIVTEKHKGTMWCDSTTEGSKFVIEIPIYQLEPTLT